MFAVQWLIDRVCRPTVNFTVYSRLYQINTYYHVMASHQQGTMKRCSRFLPPCPAASQYTRPQKATMLPSSSQLLLFRFNPQFPAPRPTRLYPHTELATVSSNRCECRRCAPRDVLSVILCRRPSIHICMSTHRYYFVNWGYKLRCCSDRTARWSLSVK